MEALIAIGSIICTASLGYAIFRLYGFIRDAAEEEYGFTVFEIKYVAGYFLSILAGGIAAYIQYNSPDIAVLSLNSIVLLATAAIIIIFVTFWLIRNTDFLIGTIAGVFQFVAAILAVGVIVIALALLSGDKKTKRKRRRVSNS